MSGAARVLVAVAAFSAVVNWVAVATQRRPLEYVAKPLTMTMLVGGALTMSPVDPVRQRWFVAAAVLCVAGDVFLMLPSDRFVPGLVAFLLGHIAYTSGFVITGEADAIRAATGVVAVAVAGAAIGRPVLGAVRRDHPALFSPVVAYLIVISTMVVAAFTVGPVLAAIGAAVFYASDSIIAWRRFLGAPRWAPVAIMVTYHAAQFALVGSLALQG